MTTATTVETGEILELENAELKFTLRADATTEILVKATGQRWEQGPVAHQEVGDFDQTTGWYRRNRTSFGMYPARFRAERVGDRVRFDVMRRGAPAGTFWCAYRLEGAWLDVEVVEIGDELASLVFPTPIPSEALLIPASQGLVRRQEDAGDGDHRASRFERILYRNPHLSMRWFGGLAGPEERHGWIAILAEGFEDAGALSSGTWAAPAWMQSLGTWKTKRRVRYGFTDGGYVGVAKRFRQWAQETGFWGASLREKREENPALDCMIGGRKIRLNLAFRRKPERYEEIWQVPPAGLPSEGEVRPVFTFAETARLLEEIKAAGMKKGVFKMGGWGKGGYDERHPDVWPPDEALGTLEEFRALCDQPFPYLSCLHDNYYDVYAHTPAFPQGVCLDPQGEPMQVGYWAGGQAYAGNTREMLPWAMETARRIAELGCRNHYFDSFAFLSQSFAPGNTLTRTEDREYKNRILDASRALGMLTGSEDGADYFVAHSHWSPKGKWTLAPGRLPLWQLVFNDAHLGYRLVNCQSQDPAEERAAVRVRCLENLLQGFAPTFMYRSWDEWRNGKPLFQETFYVDAWHAETAYDEMIDHQILSEDEQVRRSVWASGRSVTANLSDRDQEVDGRLLPARDFRLE